MDEDVKKEAILGKMDYAISVVRDLEVHPEYINFAKENWHNLINLLIEIEKDIKEY